MAIIKVFDSEGVRELSCFDTLEDVPYLDDEFDDESDEVVEDKNPFE